MPLKALIADGDDLDRDRLAGLVDLHPQLDLIDVCRDGREAFGMLQANQIDVALLDTDLPGMGGMELCRKLRAIHALAPIIIFVSTHSRSAIDAFALRAADYLLKPISGERFNQSIDVAMGHFRAQQAIEQRERILALVNAQDWHYRQEMNRSPKENPANRVVVRDAGRIRIVRSDQVNWIEADGRDCVLHCGTSKHHVDGPLFRLAQRLGEACFFQVSRFAVINIDHVLELQEMFKGNLLAKLKNGEDVSVSRRYRHRIMQRLSAGSNLTQANGIRPGL